MMNKRKVEPTKFVRVYDKFIFDKFTFAMQLYYIDKEDGRISLENATNYLRRHLGVNCMIYVNVRYDDKSIEAYLFEDIEYKEGVQYQALKNSCGIPYCELECEDEVEEITPRECVANFAIAMEEKLRANEHRGGWEHLSIDFLTYRLREEMGELFRALAIYYANPHELGARAVKDECADVANFAMMITDLVEKGKVRDKK